MSEHADSDEFVEINPDRLSGAPAVRGTRIFAQTVLSLGWDMPPSTDDPAPSPLGHHDHAEGT